MNMKLFVATHNQHKLREIGDILPGWEVVADDPNADETAETFEGNALIKVRAIAERHRAQWVMADDSGLEVAALDGAPGVRSARYAGADGDTAANNELLLKNLEGVSDRRARFVCCIALVDPEGREHTVRGECAGEIVAEPSGAGGFGYDPLFVPEGYALTYAELGEAEKNRISHRARALEAVKQLIQAEIENRIKAIIVASLDLVDLTAADIDTEAPLFGDGLGLDSIDALELGMAIKKAFAVTFSADPAENKRIFYSVKTLADFVGGKGKKSVS